MDAAHPAPERDRLAAGPIAVGAIGFGVFVPIFYYTLRRSAAGEWLWPMAEHKSIHTFLLGCLVFALISAISYLEKRIPSGIRSDHPLERNSRLVKLGVALLIAFFIGYCLHLVGYAGINGDGRAWILLADDPFLMSSEPLGRWSHYISYQAMRLLGSESKDAAVRWSSIAAGILVSFGIVAMAPSILPKGKRALGAIFLLLTPTAVLYIGYTETTPWAFAWSTTYLLAALRYYERKLQRPPWCESVILMFAIWSHGMVCFMSGSHAVLVTYWLVSATTRKSNRVNRGRAGLIAFILAGLPFVLLGVTFILAFAFGTGLEGNPWFGNALGGGDRTMLVSFGTRDPTDIFRYEFLRWDYRKDQMNLLLSACPLLPLVPFAAWSLLRSRRAETLFLLAAGGGLLLFTALWNPDAGYRTDFDLMSMFALPATVLLLLYINDFLPDTLYRLIIASITSVCVSCSIYPQVVP